MSPAIDSIASRAMLADLTIRQWGIVRANTKLTAEAARLHGVSPEMLRDAKHLVRPDAIKAIATAATAARDTHRTLTLAWSDGSATAEERRTGSRLLASAAYLDYARQMRLAEAEFTAQVDAFVSIYPREVALAEKLLNGIGEMFDPSQYPTDIKAKYAFRFHVEPLPESEHFHVLGLDAEFDRIRADLDQVYQERLAATTNEIATRIREVVGRMADRLTKYQVTSQGTDGIFRDTLVTNIRDLVAILPALNVAQDPVIAEVTERMRATLVTHSPETLRANPAARASTAKAAEEILRKMADFVG